MVLLSVDRFVTESLVDAIENVRHSVVQGICALGLLPGTSRMQLASVAWMSVPFAGVHMQTKSRV